jgi:hypothetical protein
MVNINASRFATIRGQKKGADRDDSLVLLVRQFYWFNKAEKPPSQTKDGSLMHSAGNLPAACVVFDYSA